MLSQERRLRTTDITRLFNRSNTLKIAVYPFVYFIGPQSKRWKNKQSSGEITQKTPYIQRGIQLPNKMIKTAVWRHAVKRLFYDCITQIPFNEWERCVLAVPQKNRWDSLQQALATTDKTHILDEQKKIFIKSLSLLAKKSWDLSSGPKK